MYYVRMWMRDGNRNFWSVWSIEKHCKAKTHGIWGLGKRVSCVKTGGSSVLRAENNYNVIIYNCPSTRVLYLHNP